MSRLKVDSQVETEQFRQSVYINFCTKNHIPNPSGSKPGYERVVACFIEKLMSDHNLHSATVCGYVEGINKLFSLRDLQILANLSDRSNMCTKIVIAREREEDIAWQQNPITTEMFVELQEQASRLHIDSLEAVIFNLFCLIRVTGFRVPEYNQKTQKDVD